MRGNSPANGKERALIPRCCFLLCCVVILPLISGRATPAQSGPETGRRGPGGDFSLIDHDGKPFSLQDHRGKVILLFFGYTSCTEACPVILGRINSVFKQLGPDSDKALAIFISVDPERDTTTVLREYVQYFSAHTVALTGSRDQIDAVVRQYGASYRFEKSNSALGYHVNHTTDIYLIDRGGKLCSRFNYTDRPSAIAEAVRRLLPQA